MADGAARKQNANLMPAWKPGQSGNPNGRKPGSFKKASPEAMARIVDAYLYGGPDALDKLFKNPEATPNEKFIISVIAKAVQKGDAFALNVILDRFMGKVSDKVIVTPAAAPGAAPAITDVSDEELENRKRVLREADE